MTKLSVNVNKVATLRNTRPQLNIPDVVHCAKLCLDAGAHGITVHPRPDRRHIKPDDVLQIADLLKKYPGRELNIEGNPFIDFMPIVEKVRPAQATLDQPAADDDHDGARGDREDRVEVVERGPAATRGCRRAELWDLGSRGTPRAARESRDAEASRTPAAWARARRPAPRT